MRRQTQAHLILRRVRIEQAALDPFTRYIGGAPVAHTAQGFDFWGLCGHQWRRILLRFALHSLVTNGLDLHSNV